MWICSAFLFLLIVGDGQQLGMCVLGAPATPSALRYTDAESPSHSICNELLTTQWDTWIAPNPLPHAPGAGILPREAASSNKQSPPSHTARLPAPLCLPLGEASSSQALTHAHMREQDVHHGPAPGPQLRPQRPAGAVLPVSSSQSPASLPAPGTQATCNCSVFLPAQKHFPGWTSSWRWLLEAVLPPMSMACPTSPQTVGSLVPGVQVPS